MSTHSTAACHTCPTTWDGPDADTLAHRHTTTRAKGATQHPTSSETHDVRHCGPTCHTPTEGAS